MSGLIQMCSKVLSCVKNVQLYNNLQNSEVKGTIRRSRKTKRGRVKKNRMIRDQTRNAFNLDSFHRRWSTKISETKWISLVNSRTEFKLLSGISSIRVIFCSRIANFSKNEFAPIPLVRPLADPMPPARLTTDLFYYICN
ncbi:uncharacterized protein LOC143259408 isoform X2 [Megalopta genalis]|uniref:uncharacterized protein LOC143259408 isoform X2 n=1 Tax=Megalopta genalis TaxID=115081 RepID=UPI003FD6A504